MFVAFAGSTPRASADDADKAYPVKIAVPQKVGDKQILVANGKQTRHITTTVGANPPEVQDQDLAAELEGTLEILQVDSKGSPTKLSLTVKKCAKTGADAAEILPAGAVVVAEESDGKSKFTLKDGELTPEQSEALSLLVSVAAPDSPTDDEAFGSAQPRKPGDSWDVNREKIAESANAHGVVVKADDIQGKVTMGPVTKVADKTYLNYKGEFSVDKLTVPIPGLTVKGAKMHATMAKSVPADGSKAEVSGNEKMTMEFSAGGAGPNGTQVTVIASVSMEAQRKYTPVASN
ncbi:MAG TPA: hypothetical protein VFE47_00945 [Tepidisphaeraceae bacterium]|nr:hypothetical protein [Tepidisphaeraceae bacterium]